MLRFGVPASGPHGSTGSRGAHVALGNPEASSAIEISTGGIELVCEAGEATFCVSGGDFQVVHAGARTRSWCVRTLRAGDTLAIHPGRLGSWAYLAFCGELVCKQWAGRTATHSASGLGGGCLSVGAVVNLRDTRVSEEREGELPVPDFARARKSARVVLGPQTGAFVGGSEAVLLGHEFAVTPVSDRMGMRLSGPALALNLARTCLNRPGLRGDHPAFLGWSVA